MADLELIIERLYEDIALRDELADEEANMLLQWGEAQAEQLLKRRLDDTQFDRAFAALRDLLKRINRFTGRRTKMDDETQRLQLKQLIESARVLEIEIVPQQIEMYLQQHAALNDHDNIRAMLALLTGDNQSS